MSAEKAKPREDDENSPMSVDKYAAVRDPGATPRRSLKNNNIAVVHSSDLDSEPNTEMYEAYEGEENRQEDNQPEDITPGKIAAPRKGDKEETHKTNP